MDNIRRVNMVRHDCKRDAESLDGLPLNGKTVGEMFGKVLASIDCLAFVITEMLEKQECDR